MPEQRSQQISKDMDKTTRQGVTWRAVGIGLVLVCCEATVISYSEPLISSTPMNVSHFPVGFLMWFVGVVMFLNPALKGLRAHYALSPTELLTIAVMGLLAAHVPVSGLAGFFLGTMIAPYYFASPENRWGELLHPNIPSWIAPSNADGAMQVFFEGVSPGYAIPWHIWLVPLFWWICLIGALTWMMLCLAVMLRKQWVENERLVYPLISPISDLISASDEPGWMPRVAQNRLFRIGFAVGFGIMAWNAVVFFYPILPRVDYFGRDWFLVSQFPYMTSRFNIYTFSFGYFANVDVLFSVWLFYLLLWIQEGTFIRIGYDLGPGTGAVSQWESAGGMFAFVLWSLWVARRHLRDVLRKAVWPAEAVDDSRELLSYRTAVFGFGLGGVFAICWLMASGMAFGIAVLLLLAMFFTYLGLAKVVSESGLLYLAWSISPQTLIAGAVGVRSMSPGSLTSMAFTQGLFFHGKGMFMSAFAQSARMADLVGENRRRLVVGMGLALAVGASLCFYIMLSWGYKNGAYHFNEFPFRYARETVFPITAAQIQSLEGIATGRMLFFGMGVMMMSLITFLRYRFAWWPVHPIGLAVGANGRVMKSVFSIFWVWVVKSIVLRIGGVTLYRRLRPLFVGLLAGYSLGVGFSFLVDFIWFPGQGHWVHIY
jgi:hypothetical protein